MEKRKPHFDLDTIRFTFSIVDTLRITTTATRDALALGLDFSMVVKLIQSANRHHFYKSMTSNNDPRIWQDVYHVPFEDLLIYLKFSTSARGYITVSLKEK